MSNKLAKLGDTIASHLKLSPTDPLTNSLTDRGSCQGDDITSKIS